MRIVNLYLYLFKYVLVTSKHQFCSFEQCFFGVLITGVHQSETVKNVGRMCDEARYRTVWMIYISEDLVIRAMRKVRRRRGFKTRGRG